MGNLVATVLDDRHSVDGLGRARTGRRPAGTVRS